MQLAVDPAVRAMDEVRGHPFVPPLDVLATIPKFYATERVELADKIIRLHYFAGSCDWWLVEIEPETALAFGYADLGDPASAEWGYVDLRELALLEIGGGPVVIRELPGGIRQTSFRPHVVVERDLFWTPRRWAEIDR